MVGLVVSVVLNVILGYEKYSSLKVESQKSESVMVTNVVDGDTFDINSGERVRMYGINAPEYPNGCLAEESKTRLEELILNKKIKIINKGKDNFGRSLGMIYIDKLSINKVLVTEGLAIYDGKVNPDNKEVLEMENANNEAKMTSRGLWSSKCSQLNKKCVIKGNFREADNTKVYSLPNCYNYDKTIVDPTGRDKWFCSEAEAVAAGFVKSKDCPGMK